MPAATTNHNSASAASGTASAGTGNGANTNAAASSTVKVPAAAASYTPATLDPDLRSQINMVLIRDGHVVKIQDHLLHVLHADPTNWPTAVQAHALQLLRTGDCPSFPELVRRVMDDIRADTLSNRDGNGPPTASGTSPTNTGTKTSLALPQRAVDEALRVTRESLEMVCEVEEK